MMKLNNAALVIPMFGGNWPYLDLWLSTIKKQPMDVLFFSDCDLDAPDNVTVIKSSLDDVFDRAEEALGVKITKRYPYKLCDLKSFYGLIFESELQEYKYWG